MQESEFTKYLVERRKRREKAQFPCKCGELMTMDAVWDDAQETDHAFNVYLCDFCGMLCKHDVWVDAGKRWIALDGTMTVETG
jgi:hypothetical protein